MIIRGGCYCGALTYEINGEIELAFQCHCRECQYITGGNPNIAVVFPKTAFCYSSGNPSTFSRDDIEKPVTRHFCGKCGTAIGTESPARPNSMIVKVGTLNDSRSFVPQLAIFTCDLQPYHHLPEGVPNFKKRPPKK